METHIDSISDFFRFLMDWERNLNIQDNQPAQPESNAHIDANGALIIDPMKATDVGQYSDADAKPIVRIHVVIGTEFSATTAFSGDETPGWFDFFGSASTHPT